jgi:hypothetical protein
MPPQPFDAMPQVAPEGHAGVQPHSVAVPPPPQVSGAVHVPHAIMLPQPSGAAPQF